MRKQTSIPSIRTHSPDDLLLRLQIGSAFTKPKRLIDPLIDSKPSIPPVSDCSRLSSTPSAKAVGYTAYSRLSRSPQPQVTSSSIMKMINREEVPFKPAPSLASPEPDSVKEKASFMWMKGLPRRVKTTVFTYSEPSQSRSQSQTRLNCI